MRGIEFLAPVEAMRGNLSGNQVLNYPTNDNSAWDAPAGKTSYARNYQTRYVGAKRSSSGLKYFSVRTKSAVANTPLTRLQQAALGASRVIYEQLVADIENVAVFVELFKNSGGRFKTMSGCICDYIIRGLKQRGNSFVIGSPMATAANKVIVANPFSTITPPVGAVQVTVPDDMLVKFAPILGSTDGEGMPFNIYIDGIRGLAVLVDTWGDYIEDEDVAKYRTFDFNTTTVGSKSYVRVGDAYMQYNGAYVTADTVISPQQIRFYTTPVAPTA